MTRAAQEPEASAGTLERREPRAALRKVRPVKQQPLLSAGWKYYGCEYFTLQWGRELLHFCSYQVRFLEFRRFSVLFFWNFWRSKFYEAVKFLFLIPLCSFFNFYALLLNLLLLVNLYDNTSSIFIVTLVQNLPSISGIQLSLYLQKNGIRLLDPSFLNYRSFHTSRIWTCPLPVPTNLISTFPIPTSSSIVVYYLLHTPKYHLYRRYRTPM